MAFGPGKYGANAAKLIADFGGSFCVVIMDGPKGAGFDFATTDPLRVVELPAVLRAVADSIEDDMKAASNAARN